MEKPIVNDKVNRGMDKAVTLLRRECDVLGNCQMLYTHFYTYTQPMRSKN